MLVIALFGAPNKKTFGMMPLVVKDNEKIIVRGYSQYPNGLEISDEILQTHLKSGDAIDIAYMGINLPPDISLPAAGWLGEEFKNSTYELSVPNHTAKSVRFLIPFQGSFWIDSIKNIYNCLDQWIKMAAVCAIVNNDAEVANLMKWTLPYASETEAAIWYTRKTKKEKKRYISCALATNPKSSRKKLLIKWNKIIENILKNNAK